MHSLIIFLHCVLSIFSNLFVCIPSFSLVFSVFIFFFLLLSLFIYFFFVCECALHCWLLKDKEPAIPKQTVSAFSVDAPDKVNK
jgi:hypothetical protein